MEKLTQRLASALEKRKQNGALRTLRVSTPTACDFSSNDYLGFTRMRFCQTFVAKHISSQAPSLSSGATGSRLLSGHSRQVEMLENNAAAFHGGEQALLFNSGYDANLSLLSCVPGANDAVVFDELVHASMHDGMRLSRARGNVLPFRHNDVRSMETSIRTAFTRVSGSVVVCVESVYSMDGDVAPIHAMLLCAGAVGREIGREAVVVVDEAHGGGLYGPNGEGVCVQAGVEGDDKLLARIVTYGKAFGAHGAVIVGSETLKSFLVNYARPFVYSTALPPHGVAVVRAMYAFASCEAAREARARLWSVVKHYYEFALAMLPDAAVLHADVKTPIHGVLVPGNESCVRVANKVVANGFDVFPIRSPTVRLGSERIRIIVHAHNSKDEVEALVSAIADALEHERARARL